MSNEERRKFLGQHADECEECREALPVRQLGEILDSGEPAVDADALSRRVLLAARSELHARAARLFRRQVLRALLICLAPLAAVVAYDIAVLGVVYSLLISFLPSTLATWMVTSYAALCLLLFTATYAAIPILVSRQRPRLEIA